MRTILIVDADENSRSLCARHFEAAGYRVLTAGSRDEAAEWAEDRRVDVVIADVDVPGLDVMDYLARFWNRDVPVIVHTATADCHDVIPDWLPEARLRKTGDSAELKAAVGDALKRREKREMSRLCEAVLTDPYEPEWSMFGGVRVS